MRAAPIFLTSIFLTSIALTLIAPTVFAADGACVATSTADRVHVVELYTSEGCSSCPPAERWLSTLRDKPAYIGLEYHVDYWDSSDWKDPYSSARYTSRQKALVRREKSDVSYTPQIAVDGRVWKTWPKGAPPEADSAAAPELRLEALPGDGLRARVSTSGAAVAEGQVFVALAQNGLSNKIRGGENRGATLNHDHVVRAFAGPLQSGTADAELSVPKEIDWTQSSLVAFVQSDRDGAIVQAVRLPLAGCRQ